MKHIRRSLIFLAVDMAILFNIERLDLREANVIDIQTFVYVLALGAVVASIGLPVFYASPLRVSLMVWGGIYLMVKGLVYNDRPLIGGIYTYLSITELALLLLTVYAAHSVGESCHDFVLAVENITLSKVRRSFRPVEKAAEDIELEMLRSRRHQYSLSVVVVEPDPASIRARLHRTVQEVQKEMMARYVWAALATTIGRELRRTDMVLEERSRGRFIVLSPETSSDGSVSLAHRIQTTALERLGVTVICGAATFPEAAVSFEELVRAAERNRPSNLRADGAGSALTLVSEGEVDP